MVTPTAKTRRDSTSDSVLELAQDLSELELQLKFPGIHRDNLTPRERRQLKLQLSQLNDLVQSGEAVPVGKAHGRITFVPRTLVQRRRREQMKESANIPVPDRCLLTRNSIILASHSNEQFATLIARMLGVSKQNFTLARTRKFSDGEPLIEIDRSTKLRGAKVYLFPNTREPIEKNVIELILTIQAAKIAGAASVNVVMPYWPFGRSDRPERQWHTSVGAEAFASLLKNAGADFVFTIDPHSMKPIDPYFKRDKQMLVLYGYNLASPVLMSHLKGARVDFKNLIVMSPDRGGLLRVMFVSEELDRPAGWLNKHRDKPNHVGEITGPYVAEWEQNGNIRKAGRRPLDVKGKDILVIDDMSDTGGTNKKSCKHLKDLGARRIFQLCTHAVLSGPGYRRLMNMLSDGTIDHAFFTNSIPWRRGYPKTGKVTILDVGPFFAEAIRRHNRGKSFEPLHKPTWRKHAKVPAAKV